VVNACRMFAGPEADCNAGCHSRRALNAQSICDFFNSPLISDQIAGTCNYCRLPPVSMIFANLDFCLSCAQRRNDHVG
jgi:hypothetical protein